MGTLLFHISITLPIAIFVLLWIWVLLVPFTVVVHIPRLYMRARGLALPGIIIITPGMGECILRHELKHQQQFRRYSPLGATLLLGYHYSRDFLLGRWRNGRWPSFLELWARNPLEMEANAAMNNSDPIRSIELFGGALSLVSVRI
jgi:hypothetical protein